jgi:hypothetical protein
VKVIVLPPKVPTNSDCEFAVMVVPPKVPTKADSELVVKVTVLPLMVPTNAEFESFLKGTAVPPIVAIKAAVVWTVILVPPMVATNSGSELMVTAVPPIVPTVGTLDVCGEGGFWLGGGAGCVVSEGVLVGVTSGIADPGEAAFVFVGCGGADVVIGRSPLDVVK